MKRPGLAFLSTVTVLLSSPAGAICYYNGAFNVRATIQQEFADSKWVVHARVLSATDGVFQPETPDETSWTTYQLEIVRSDKGKAPARLEFFTERNSGGFYMDRPWVKLPAGHDIGGEYLLFLNPNMWSGTNAAPRNSVFVIILADSRSLGTRCLNRRAESLNDYPEVLTAPKSDRPARAGWRIRRGGGRRRL